MAGQAGRNSNLERPRPGSGDESLATPRDWGRAALAARWERRLASLRLWRKGLRKGRAAATGLQRKAAGPERALAAAWLGSQALQRQSRRLGKSFFIIRIGRALASKVPQPKAALF